MTAEQVESRNAETILPAGTQAPQFTLASTPGKSYSLSDFKGKPVVLAFYPADWSPVCGDQVALYNEMLDEFASLRRGIAVLDFLEHFLHVAVIGNDPVDEIFLV